MREINKIAEALFEKIRDRFDDVSLGDENAKATQNPEDARFFNFDYTVDDEKHGNITMSLIDEISLKVYFSKNLSLNLDEPHKKDWYNFLRELREFARRNLLSFEPRDITRATLKHRDLQTISKADGTYSKDEVVSEGRMYGTMNRSYESFGPVRIKVAHSKPVVDEVKGSRGRNIQTIYVENDQGERFKLPFSSLTGARAMARHVSAGGVPTDAVGQHITELVNEMMTLRPFVLSMRHRTFEDSSTNEMLESAFEYHSLLKNTLKKLKGAKGYTKFKENFEPLTSTIEANVDEIKEKFVKKVFPDKLAEALPIVQKAYEMKKANNNPLVKTFEEWASKISEGIWAAPDNEEDQRELTKLLEEPLPVGVDAANATGALYNLIGDDELYDQLAYAAEQDPEEDARPMIIDWLVNNGYEHLVPEEQQGKTTGSAMGGQDGVVNESSDSFEAVQAAIIRRIARSHPNIVAEFGFDAIVNAVEDEAAFIGDVDEIGTSDVSAWVNRVIQSLRSGQYGDSSAGDLKETADLKANLIAKIISKLIGEGHTEVSPEVVMTKISAATGKPFMLKDLVSANNSSPLLKRYIASINPTKIKFSTDILTVKNENPAKKKAKAQSAVSSMASRAANRPRLGENVEYDEEDEDEDENEMANEGFYVVIANEDNGVFIGMLVKEYGPWYDGRWYERRVSGQPPRNWGGPKYMGYLKPRDIMTWLHKDFDRQYQVKGPFADQESAQDAAEYMMESNKGLHKLDELSPDLRDRYGRAAQKDMARHSTAAKIKRNVYGVDNPESAEHEKRSNKRERGLELARKREMNEAKGKLTYTDGSNAIKTRNFVAKNAPTSGAGAHKDRKRADKYGETKHKKKVTDDSLNEQKGPSSNMKEGRRNPKPAVNFSIEDIKNLEQIENLPILKDRAFALISKPSRRPMKPEKVSWFKSVLDQKNSRMGVIKLMYDLLLSGEGHQVIGSRNSLDPNKYRNTFGEGSINQPKNINDWKELTIPEFDFPVLVKFVGDQIVVAADNIEIEGESPGRFWLSFSADLTTGKVLTMDGSWNRNPPFEIENVDPGVLSSIVEEVLDSVRQHYGTTEEEIRSELEGGFGVGESTENPEQKCGRNYRAEKMGVPEGALTTMKPTGEKPFKPSMSRPKGEWDPIHGKAPKKGTLKYDIWKQKVQHDKGIKQGIIKESGETYTWTATFADGSQEQMNITTDEVPYAREAFEQRFPGKEIVKVSTDWKPVGSGYYGSMPTSAIPDRRPTEPFGRDIENPMVKQGRLWGTAGKILESFAAELNAIVNEEVINVGGYSFDIDNVIEELYRDYGPGEYHLADNIDYNYIQQSLTTGSHESRELWERIMTLSPQDQRQVIGQIINYANQAANEDTRDRHGFDLRRGAEEESNLSTSASIPGEILDNIVDIQRHLETAADILEETRSSTLALEELTRVKEIFNDTFGSEGRTSPEFKVTSESAADFLNPLNAVMRQIEGRDWQFNTVVDVLKNCYKWILSWLDRNDVSIDDTGGIKVGDLEENYMVHKEDAENDVELSRAARAKINEPAYQRKKRGGDWQVSPQDIKDAGEMHSREFSARKKDLGLDEAMADLRRLAGLK